MKKISSVLLVICLLATAAMSIFPASAANEPAPKTYEGYIEQLATPITTDVGVQTYSGGTRDIKSINDGLTTEKGNTGLIYSYDSYIPANREDKGAPSEIEQYVGYTFEQAYTVTELVFFEGASSAGGGYFEGKTLHVEVYDKETDTWSDVATNIASVYSQSETYVAAEHVANDRYYITLNEPTLCDGIRLIGIAGGTSNYFSCAELLVKASGLMIENGQIESISKPIVSKWHAARDTTAGGTRRLNSIRDGYMENDFKMEFGNYKNNNAAAFGQNGYIGYEFPQSFTVEKMMFKAGTAWVNGGWFADGVKVEALINGAWVEVASDAGTVYPVSNNQADHAVNDAVSGTNKGYAEYNITLNRPVECDGIRLAGTFGGTHYYITCLEFQVFTTEDHKNEFKYDQASAIKDNKYAVRLISELDRTDYDTAGYEVTLTVGDKSVTKTVTTTKVFRGFMADSKPYTADAGKCFVLVSITDIPANATDVTFTVTPMTTKGAETFYGAPVTFTYNNGVVVTK